MSARILQVGIVGFEPAIRAPLEILLSAEPDLDVVAFPPEWSPLDAVSPALEVDVLLIDPLGPDWVERLHAHFPKAAMLAMVEWHHRHLFQGGPIRMYFERCQGYVELLALLRQLGEAL